MEELKPCPFCGCVPVFTYGPAKRFMSHGCDDKNEDGPNVFSMTVKQWNTRPQHTEGGEDALEYSDELIEAMHSIRTSKSKEVRTCETCKFEELGTEDTPCRQCKCIQKSNWQSKLETNLTDKKKKPLWDMVKHNHELQCKLDEEREANANLLKVNHAMGDELLRAENRVADLRTKLAEAEKEHQRTLNKIADDGMLSWLRSQERDLKAENKKLKEENKGYANTLDDLDEHMEEQEGVIKKLGEVVKVNKYPFRSAATLLWYSDIEEAGDIVIIRINDKRYRIGDAELIELPNPKESEHE